LNWLFCTDATKWKKQSAEENLFWTYNRRMVKYEPTFLYNINSRSMDISETTKQRIAELELVKENDSLGRNEETSESDISAQPGTFTEPVGCLRALNNRLSSLGPRNNTCAATKPRSKCSNTQRTRHGRRRGVRGRRGGKHGKKDKSKRTQNKHLRIISWNIRSHKKRRSTIEKLLLSNNILMAQETKLKERPTYDGYTVYFRASEDGGNAKRGLLIVVNEETHCCQIPTPRNNKGVETLAISVIINGKEHVLVNMYVPGDSLKTAEDWNSILDPLMQLGERVIISGDMNARSPQWMDTGYNVNGHSLEEALESVNGVIINNCGPTRHAERAGDSDSCIDITIVSPVLLIETTWSLLPLMGSDHCPTLVTIRRQKPNIERRKTSGFKYDSRNRTVISKLRRDVKTDKQNKVKEPKSKKPVWMTEEVERKWEAKITASKAYSNAKKDHLSPETILERKIDFKRTTAEYQRTAENRRQEEWDKFCQNSDPANSKVQTQFWNLAKNMSKTKNGQNCIGPQVIFGPNGEQLKTDEEKGNAFLARFKSQLQQNGSEVVKNAWEKADQRIREDDSREKPVTLHELESVLHSIEKDTAPGPDGVQYSRINDMSSSEKCELVNIINDSMLQGKINEDLQYCKMAVLPKPLKDHSKLKGYRMITMANVWVKLMEKVAARRIVKDLEERNCIPPEVGGARPKRSTTSNVEAVIHDIQQGMQEHKHCAIAVFDFEDAYNKVNVGILAEKMRRMRVSDTLIRWVLAMLDSRKCKLSFGQWDSDIFEVSSGLPQGSPLSPVLFNIYTTDLVAAVSSPTVSPKLYVDDGIVYSISTSIEEAMSDLQTATDEFHLWATENKMSAQAEKAGWMLATRSHADPEQLQLWYGGEEVPRKESLVCLGVIIDRKMTMNGHADSLRTKAAKTLGLLRYAAAQKVQQQSLWSLAQATVASKMEYGLHLCMCVSKTNMSKLQRVQNATMRIVTGAAKPTSCMALQYWLGATSVMGRQKLLAAKAFLKAITTQSHPLCEALQRREDESVTQRLKTVRSWVVDAREIVEEVCTVEDLVTQEWIETESMPLVANRIGNRTWRERAQQENMSDVGEWLEQQKPSVIIATDGSLREDTTAWAGAVWRNGKQEFEWSTARQGKSSSFRAESEALEDALVWIARNTDNKDNVTIFTDSLSIVQKLENHCIRKDWLPILESIETSVTVCYIPGHSGLVWNEKADELAGIARPFGLLKHTAGDVMSELKHKTKESELIEQRKFWSVQRLEERGRKYGDGSQMTTRGRMRSHVNQQELGVITKRTLQKLLGEKGQCF